MIIASDIHMNDDPDKRPTMLSIIRTAAENQDDKTIIISGDLTCNGTQKEFEEITLKLNEMRDSNLNIVIAPGNHDTSQSLIVTRIKVEERSRRYAALMDCIAKQSIVVNRRDSFDMIYRIDKDVFFAARSTHHRLHKPTRIRRKQFEWAKLVLMQEGLVAEKGYRLHLVTHQSLWQLDSDGDFEGDKHNHMHNRGRLRREFLEPLQFSTAINGHNHNFTEGMRTIKGYLDYQIYHIQAPTLSEYKAHKRKYTPGYVIWDPAKPSSAELVPIATI